jgi:hypothetical protein
VRGAAVSATVGPSVVAENPGATAGGVGEGVGSAVEENPGTSACSVESPLAGRGGGSEAVTPASFDRSDALGLGPEAETLEEAFVRSDALGVGSGATTPGSFGRSDAPGLGPEAETGVKPGTRSPVAGTVVRTGATSGRHSPDAQPSADPSGAK